MRKFNAIIAIINLLLVVNMSWAQSNNYAGDSVLYFWSNRTFDSIRTNSFFEMREKGLKMAEDKDNAHFKWVFRSYLPTHYQIIGDYEGYKREAYNLIEYCQKNDDILHLYNTWRSLCDYSRRSVDFSVSFDEINKMLNYAIKHGHKYGMAEANYCLAKSYHDSKQMEEAEKLYAIALEQYKDFEVYYMSFMAELGLFSIYIDQKRYDEAENGCARLGTYISKWETSKKMKVNPVMRTQLALNKMQLYVSSDKMDLASQQLDSIAYYTNIYNDHSQDYKIKSVSYLYYLKKGDFEAAGKMVDWLIGYTEYKSSIPLMAQAYRYKALLEKNRKNYEEACTYYEKFKTYTDSAEASTYAQQLNILTKTFNLKKLKWEKEKAETRIWILVCGLTLIATILCLMAVYSYKLRKRNTSLCQQVEDYAKRHEEMMNIKSAAVECRIAAHKDVPLFDKLEKLMHDQKLFCSSELNRDMLAEKLGTNRTYLSDCIKDGCGKSYIDYITDLRLTEAVKIIERKPNEILTSISEQVGYSTYSTFLRAFSKRYGITPADYVKFTK